MNRPRVTLLLLGLFVVLAAVLGGPVAGQLSEEGGFAPTDADSVRAVERIEAATGEQARPGVLLLVADPTAARLSGLGAQLSAVDGVARVVPAGTAVDGSSALLAATLTADADDTAVVDAAHRLFDDTPGVLLGGGLVVNQQIGDAVSADLARAELLAFPVLLLLSLLLFRGGRAALIPLIVGVSTVLGTFLVLLGVNQVYGLSVFALNLVIGLGLGLGIDYALFLLTRFREEMAVHGPGELAVRRTMATAGRTVVFSAATVAVSLAALTVFPLGFLQSMGIAGAVVALVAAAAALVAAPALFLVWGTKLAVRRQTGAEARWYRLSHLVLRRPGAVAIATGLLMLVLAAPALRVQFTPVDATAIPAGTSSRTVADTVTRDYPGAGTSPVTIVVEDDAAQVRAYADRLAARPGVLATRPPQQLDSTTWQIDLAVDGQPDGDLAQQLVRDVRSADPGVLVTGAAAEFIDQQDALGARLPLALALLGLLTFAVLWLMTGSVVLPIKAIVMNVLTVGSALGVLTLVFQDGRLEGLLGYTSNGGVEPTDFLVSAALIFALSTDYGVFLLGRIKEVRNHEADEREAVAVGLSRTGAVVTSAAILLAVAIGAFITSSISFIQQIGVATAAGVLIDAFVVRTFLVPSLMGLLGSRNWWSPAPLRRLHDRIGISEEIPTAPPGVLVNT